MARRPGLLFALVLSVPLVANAAQKRHPVHIPQPDFWIESGAGGAPRFFVDSAVFPAAGDSMRIEAYYRISYGGIQFSRAAQGYSAGLAFELFATADGGRQPVARVHKERVLDIPNEVYQEAAAYSLLYQVDLVVPRDDYYVETVVTQDGAATGEPARAHWWANEPETTADGLAFGEVQLTDHIAPARNTSLFQKGGVEFHPNPTRRFSDAANTLVFYTENFNGGDAQVSLHLRYGIQDLYGDDHWGGEAGRVDGGVLDLKPGSNVLLSGFKLTSLGTGFYRLLLEYMDPAGELVARRSRVFSYQVAGETLEPPDPYLSTLDDTIVDQYADRFFRYLGTPEDISRYEALATRPARRRFIVDWWKRVAEEKGLSVANYRASVLNRYEIADMRYAEGGRPGWRTDRGRIFIIYGEPIEVQKYQVETEARASEEWTMMVRGRRRFCYFLDRQGTGEYTLDATDIQGEAAAHTTRPIFDDGTSTTRF